MDAAKRLNGLLTNILSPNKQENQGIFPEAEVHRQDELLRNAILSFAGGFFYFNITLTFR